MHEMCLNDIIKAKFQFSISSAINYCKHIKFSMAEVMKSFVIQLY